MTRLIRSICLAGAALALGVSMAQAQSQHDRNHRGDRPSQAQRHHSGPPRPRPSARNALTTALTIGPATDPTTDRHRCRTTKAGAVSAPTTIGTEAAGYRRRTARAITWSMIGAATASRRRRAATTGCKTAPTTCWSPLPPA